jgi:hypothetical protein
MALSTTTLDLYGGVLWSGELQGFIVHEMMPTMEYGIHNPVPAVRALLVVGCSKGPLSPFRFSALALG